MFCNVSWLFGASTASTPPSAGKGCCSMRSSAKAFRVISMLCVMNGASRTSSFGLTMKLVTYQLMTPTTT
jgi:hypothetical protein